MFFTLNRSFYPSTFSTTSVRAGSSILEEIQVLWAQSYATEILRCHVGRSTAAEWAMQCHVIILDTTGTTYIFYDRETKGNNQRENKNKEDKSKEKKKKKKMKAKTRRNNLSCPPPAGEGANT